jgi:23S rRNA A1618 N6-methylase RlmF
MVQRLLTPPFTQHKANLSHRQQHPQPQINAIRHGNTQQTTTDAKSHQHQHTCPISSAQSIRQIIHPDRNDLRTNPKHTYPFSIDDTQHSALHDANPSNDNCNQRIQ